MANIASAKKAHKQSLARRVFNVRRMRAMKESVRGVEEAAASGNKSEAEGLLSTAYKAIDKAAKRGIIKPNAAARKKSRLSAKIAKLS